MVKNTNVCLIMIITKQIESNGCIKAVLEGTRILAHGFTQSPHAKLDVASWCCTYRVPR